eukprot:2642060-Rhodomonas_salina.6
MSGPDMAHGAIHWPMLRCRVVPTRAVQCAMCNVQCAMCDVRHGERAWSRRRPALSSHMAGHQDVAALQEAAEDGLLELLTVLPLLPAYALAMPCPVLM